MLSEIVEFHCLRANETSLEIGVNNTGSLRGFGAISDSPAFDLVCTSGEVVDKLKVFVSSLDDSVDHGGSTQFFSFGGLNFFVILVSSDNFGLKFS
jgi:hypothetical protein